MNKNITVTLSTSQSGCSIQIAANLLLCFLFRFRLWCQRVIGHKMFDHVILLFIFLNCITIALERPDIQPNSMVTHTSNLHSHVLAQFLQFTVKLNVFINEVSNIAMIPMCSKSVLWLLLSSLRPHCFSLQS